MKRRSSIEIIAEILKLGETRAGKTYIMYHVNMSHSQLNRYLDLLIRGGFLEQDFKGNPDCSSMQFNATPKGKRLLRDIEKITTLLESELINSEKA